MKYRSDFVTNSSSSSFIISKETGCNSIEDVFALLKTLCQEFLDKQNALIEHCKQDKRFVVYEENGNTRIKFAKEKPNPDEWFQAKEFIHNQFDMSWYDVGYGDIGWLACETYADLLEYGKDKYFYITIVDLLNPEFDKDSDIDSVSSLIQWYMPCYESIYTKDCEQCSERHYCAVNKCDKKVKKEIKNIENNQEMLMTFFGRFCICSECGYIPEYVVNKLGEVSSFWCNHMG